MALSRDFTAKRAWAEAISDLGIQNLDHGQRFMLLNRAQNAVAVSFPILWKMYVTRATGTPSGNTASLAALRVNHAADGEIELESDQTTSVDAVTTLDLRTFNASSIHNAKRIVYALSGNRLFLAKGSGLSSYGTLTVRYVRIPTTLTADTDYVDVPDGAAMEIFILKLKEILRERYGLPSVNTDAKMSILEKQLFDGLNVETALEGEPARIKKLN